MRRHRDRSVVSFRGRLSNIFQAFRSTAQNGILFTGNDADTSEARDINDRGELVGASTVVNGQYHAMYKTTNTIKDQGWFDLGVLQQPCPGTWSRANGINNNGLIVGQAGYGGGCTSLVLAFVVSNEGDAGSQPMLNLTDRTYVFQNGQWYSAASQGWAIVNAERINDGNWIVGTAQNGGATYAVLLTPR